jgi:hypothetical protein
MTEADVSASTFYRERVPAQFNSAHDAQARIAESDDAAARVLAEMRSVKATIGIVVRGENADERFDLDIANGRMAATDSPTHTPFLTLVHDSDTLATLARESGDSVLGFLGALAGMGQAMLLTSQRIQNLHALEGSLRFEVTGGSVFSLMAVFGGSEVPDEASCSISLDRDTYGQLLNGELNAQNAFMEGRVAVTGDMQLVMQLALAAMSPS